MRAPRGHHQVTGVELDALDGPDVSAVEDADFEAGVGVPDVNAAVRGAR